jgi:hypothetical protein
MIPQNPFKGQVLVSENMFADADLTSELATPHSLLTIGQFNS